MELFLGELYVIPLRSHQLRTLEQFDAHHPGDEASDVCPERYTGSFAAHRPDARDHLAGSDSGYGRSLTR